MKAKLLKKVRALVVITRERRDLFRVESPSFRGYSARPDYAELMKHRIILKEARKRFKK